MSNFIIDIDLGRQPHNSLLILTHDQLQQIMPLIREEMMQGLVSTEGNDKVRLFLNLDPAKILKVSRLAQQEKKVA